MSNRRNERCRGETGGAEVPRRQFKSDRHQASDAIALDAYGE
jgi:hypothetical protein